MLVRRLRVWEELMVGDEQWDDFVAFVDGELFPPPICGLVI